MLEFDSQERVPMNANGTFGGLTQMKFDNPFLLPSSQYYPTTLSEAFQFCKFLYYSVPIYRQVVQRTVRYFITDFEFPGDGSSEEKSKLKEYLTYNLRLPAMMAEIGDEWGCYGNAFTYIYYPFKRFLVDRRGKLTQFHNIELFTNLEEKMKFNPKDLTYTVPDPKNNYQGQVTLPFIDVAVKQKEGITLNKVPPEYIRIQHNSISGKSRYIRKFDNIIKTNVKSGKYFVDINNTPKTQLEAITKDQDFAFYDDELFHFRAPVVSGFSYQDWGLPETMANYRQIYNIFILQKIDETVALDYMLPFRIFSAVPGGDGGDIFNSTSMEQWSAEIKKIIDSRRKDKFAMHSFPFPVNYQEFGASGKQLAPKDLLEFQINNLLNCCGFPEELFRCSLTVQQLPTALRLFQQNFWFIHDNFNNLVKWVVRKIQNYLEEQPIEVKLQLPKLADNLEQLQQKIQLGMQGELPRRYYLSEMGVADPVAAAIERAEEDLQIQMGQAQKQKAAELKANAEQQLEQAATEDNNGGAMGNTGVQDREAQAQAKAEEWLSIQSDGERSKAMQATKASDYELYANAKQIMEDMRNKQKADAYQQSKQQG